MNKDMQAREQTKLGLVLKDAAAKTGFMLSKDFPDEETKETFDACYLAKTDISEAVEIFCGEAVSL